LEADDDRAPGAEIDGGVSYAGTAVEGVIARSRCQPVVPAITPVEFVVALSPKKTVFSLRTTSKHVVARVTMEVVVGAFAAIQQIVKASARIQKLVIAVVAAEPIPVAIAPIEKVVASGPDKQVPAALAPCEKVDVGSA
jgi:hypothetical protein